MGDARYTPEEPPRIGLIGGSFNPPHLGHLLPALEVKEALGLDQLHFVPSGNHPFKGEDVLAPVEHRLAMTRTLVSKRSGCDVWDIEARSETTSYTIDTLERFAERYPGAQRVFCFGSDILQELHLWKRWQDLPSLAHLCIMVRPGVPQGLLETTKAGCFLEKLRVHSIEDLFSYHPSEDVDSSHAVWVQNVTPVDMSSTTLREWVQRAAPEGVTEAVPAGLPREIADYMERHALYRT
ncbi:MAG: nicotinate (nicotinamide) nucleotide adenylyltransferase [Magnetococcales bacterium]|nr:nicotinate (nicotinamide) nucleotide adenylyltransferase [Magnetococcales bacterium]